MGSRVGFFLSGAATVLPNYLLSKYIQRIMRTDPFISVVCPADLTYDSFKIGLVKNGLIL